MVDTKTQPCPLPTLHRARVSVASKVAQEQWEGPSPRPPDQMLPRQRHAIAARAQQTKLITAEHQQYRYGHCLPPQWLAAGSRQRQGPSVLLVRCGAAHQAKPE